MHDRSFFQLPFAAGLALCVAACAPSLGGAVRAYEHGRYAEAMEELRAVEMDACRATNSDATRYALYRGLTHFALGDLAATRAWFGPIERAVATHPELLSSDETQRLASARAHLPR
jgi:hypothetical protein